MFRCIFFFKQKTAYEMRISDWSSDVCSSDLFRSSNPSLPLSTARDSARSIPRPAASAADTSGPANSSRIAAISRRQPSVSARPATTISRTEEHTSELQSIMRNSYADFRLTTILLYTSLLSYQHTHL